jgi:hypothetical protein
MNKLPCYCDKCKGALVSKRTFRRHLLKEQYYIKHKQITEKKVKKVKNEHFDIYSNQSLPISPLPNESTYISDHIATTRNMKSICRSIPSIPILQENFILNSELEDNDSIISENHTEFIGDRDDDDDEENYSDEIISEYEDLDEYYTNANYNPINIFHNPPILDANETTKQVIFWAYSFQDTFLLPQTASAALLDFFKELLQSFDENKFSDFPSTIYRADRLLGVELTYKNYIVCPQCHQLYLPDILNSKDQHIKCKCNEIITKMIRTSKGNHLIKVIKVKFIKFCLIFF